MKCHNCSALLDQHNKFCPDCGAAVKAPLCPHCGVELAKLSKFCPECGGATETAPRATNAGGAAMPIAIQHLHNAADLGSADAMYNLAKLYEKGETVEQDLFLSTQWHRKAAEKGNADAQYTLAFSYLNGIVVEKNDVEAALWLDRAAEKDAAFKKTKQSESA